VHFVKNQRNPGVLMFNAMVAEWRRAYGRWISAVHNAGIDGARAAPLNIPKILDTGAGCHLT